MAFNFEKLKSAKKKVKGKKGKPFPPKAGKQLMAMKGEM